MSHESTSKLYLLGLGSWRFFLAFCVAISHLWSGMIHGPAAYAVWGFFVLSGYLMTSILIEKYGETKSGLYSYGFNRFIRIFPQYWLSCILGLVTCGIALRHQVDVKFINPEFFLPEGTYNIITNIFLNPFFEPLGRLVPVSGALATEIGVYLLIPLFCRSKSAAICVLCLALISNCERKLTVDTFPVRYTFLSTCILAFSVGSLVYHFKNSLLFYSNSFLSVAVWLLHSCAWIIFPSYPWEMGLYVSVLLSAWVVLSLCDRTSSKFDVFLGDLSYPVYLLHSTVAIWPIILIGDQINQRSFLFFAITFTATVALSVIVVFFFDRPIMKLKKRPKAAANKPADPSRLT